MAFSLKQKIVLKPLGRSDCSLLLLRYVCWLCPMTSPNLLPPQSLPSTSTHHSPTLKRGVEPTLHTFLSDAQSLMLNLFSFTHLKYFFSQKMQEKQDDRLTLISKTEKPKRAKES